MLRQYELFPEPSTSCANGRAVTGRETGLQCLLIGLLCTLLGIIGIHQASKSIADNADETFARVVASLRKETGGERIAEANGAMIVDRREAAKRTNDTLEIRNQALVAIGKLLDAEKRLDKLIGFDQSAEQRSQRQQWPEYVQEAWGRLAEVDRQFSAALPRLKAAFQRVANGDTSPEGIEQAKQSLVALRNYLQNGKQATIGLERATDRYACELRQSAFAVRQTNAEREREADRRRHGILGMTVEGYESLVEGMGSSQVDRALGCAGVEQSSSGDLTTYLWQDGFKIITATFENDRLIGKAQAGL